MVDRTPPQVVIQSPTPGAQQISVRQPIYVKFAEPLKPASVADATVRLTLQVASATVELAKTLSLSVDGTVLTIVPNSKPSVPSQVSVTLVAVTDHAGNTVSTQANTWEWSHPVWVPVGGVLRAFPDNYRFIGAEFPSLALDAQGNPVVAWRETPPTANSPDQYKVFVQRWIGTAWEAIGGSMPDESTVGFAGPPSLELEASGRPVVAWTDIGSYVYINRWEQGSWQELGRVWNGEIGAAVNSPSLYLDGAGGPAVAWIQDDYGTCCWPYPPKNAYFSRWTGTQWAMHSELSAHPGQETSASDIVLRVGSLNMPVVAWSEFDGAATNVHVWRQDESGWQAIGSPLSAKPGRTHAVRPRLQLTASDLPVVAWSEDDEGSTSGNIYVQRWTGSAWESLGNGVNSEPSITRANAPSLVVNASGNPIVAWAGDDGTTANIHVHQWKEGHWEPLGPALSANAGNTHAGRPALRLDSEGVPVVAWDEVAQLPGNLTTRNVYVYRFNH